MSAPAVPTDGQPSTPGLSLAPHASPHRPAPRSSRLRRALGLLRARWVLRGCKRGRHVCVEGPLVVRNEGQLVLGARITFAGGMLPTALLCHAGARLEVGDACVFNYGASLEAHGLVRIGQRCMFASFVRLCDLTPTGEVRPIVLGDDVWLAHGAIVAPGVTIGEGSVVAA
ncbi:MAG TPA: acyltransferase, partial [Aggregicoccus sp.]|nr:acyltransferase [Aggregicoccus sp.]